MSTRGAYGFIAKNKVYATYNHSDSYPSCLGNTILEFCAKINETKKNEFETWGKLKDSVLSLKSLGRKKYNPTLADKRFYSSLFKRKDFSQFRELISGASSNGDMLNLILKGKLKHIANDEDFLLDSLFCEFAYLINLDDWTLEFYKGFQKSPTKGNRFGEKALGSRSKYYPVALKLKIFLEDILKDEIENIQQEIVDSFENEYVDPFEFNSTSSSVKPKVKKSKKVIKKLPVKKSIATKKAPTKKPVKKVAVKKAAPKRKIVHC
jgi:hypothetical protein